MAVHNLSAVDLHVSEWQPMDIFPKDGDTYDIRDGSGEIATAFWGSDGKLRVVGNKPMNPTHWRYPQQED